MRDVSLSRTMWTQGTKGTKTLRRNRLTRPQQIRALPGNLRRRTLELDASSLLWILGVLRNIASDLYDSQRNR